MFFVLWKYNVDKTLNQVLHFLYDISIMLNRFSEHISSIKFCLRLLHCQNGFFALRLPTFAFVITVKKGNAKRQRKKDLRSNFHKTALFTLFNLASTCPTKFVTKSNKQKYKVACMSNLPFPFLLCFPKSAVTWSYCWIIFIWSLRINALANLSHLCFKAVYSP